MYLRVALTSSFVLVSAAQNLPIPPLPYDYNSLEPHIDEATMRVHHVGHHGTYTKNINDALTKLRADTETKAIAKQGLDQLIRNLGSVPESVRQSVRNNGGGWINHDFFWNILAPPSDGGGGTAFGQLGDEIDRVYGSFEAFRDAFTKVALGRFGSGWAWLYYSHDENRLQISSTPNQDSPMMDGNNSPIIAVDVWEHAYYLKHQNKRAAYLADFWHVANWRKAGELYEAAANVAPKEL